MVIAGKVEAKIARLIGNNLGRREWWWSVKSSAGNVLGTGFPVRGRRIRVSKPSTRGITDDRKRGHTTAEALADNSDSRRRL